MTYNPYTRKHDISFWTNQDYLRYSHDDAKLSNGGARFEVLNNPFGESSVFGQFINYYNTAPVTIEYDRGNDRNDDPQHIQISDQRISHDFLITNGGNDVVSAGGGDDLVTTGAGRDIVLAGDGDDVVMAGIGSDMVFGGAGNDYIYGDDELWASKPSKWGSGPLGDFGFYDGLGTGRNPIHQKTDPFNPRNESENDVLFGGEGDDHVFGRAGDDALFGGVGNDTAFGGDGEDMIHGEAGDDQLSGGNDRDVIHGGDGNDVISGGDGADSLFGGNGDDVIDAGRRGLEDNHDVLTGGAGGDIFYLLGTDNGGNSEALDVFAAFNQQAVAENADNSAVEDIALSSLKSIANAVIGKGTKMLPFGAEQTAGKIGEHLVDEFFNLFRGEGETPLSSADLIEVTDFDPTEDLLVIPVHSDHDLEIEVVYLGGSSAELHLKYDTGSSAEATTFAKIRIDEKFLKSIGIPEGDVALATSWIEAIFEASVRGAVKVGLGTDGGIGNVFNVDAQSTGDVEGSHLLLFGASGSLARTAKYDTTDGAPIVGTRFDDVLSGHDEFFDLGDENDFQTTGRSDDAVRIFGFGGDDLLIGSNGGDTIDGGTGNDTMYASGSGNSFDSVNGLDTLRGGSGDDLAYASAGFDNLFADGGSGHDTFDFSYNEEGVVLHSQEKADGHSIIFVGYDSDAPANRQDLDDPQYKIVNFEAVRGSEHADHFDFSQVNSNLSIEGGAGDDVLKGGQDDDLLCGDAGADTFRFDVQSGNDRIVDFEYGVDQIEFGGLTESDVKVRSMGDDLARIDFEGGNSVLVAGEDANLLITEDFIFI